jgi:hypothetical protein
VAGCHDAACRVPMVSVGRLLLLLLLLLLATNNH